jgi:hypothetical protein
MKVVIVDAAILIALGAYWVWYLQKAHSTFDNYYKFRGCRELIQKTDGYGTCKLKDGTTIKIVKYQGKWFLDGDLPTGHFPDF